MTTTGFIYDPASGERIGRIENETDLLGLAGEKVGTVSEGNVYGIEGELQGHLSAPDGRVDAPVEFMDLLRGRPRGDA